MHVLDGLERHGQRLDYPASYSVGQVIDEDPGMCDFARLFGPAKGAVALDCDGDRFRGWKFRLTSGMAIKDTEPCQLFDGLIIY